MFIILGGTGHVGSAVADTLLNAGEPVTIVTRDRDHVEAWRARGAEIAVADVHDVEAMRDTFRLGRRLFLLNPPAAPTTDTDAVEKETIRCLLDAIDGSGLEMIVAESTYGAQAGERCGDLNTLFEMEEGLRRQAIPHAILRAAYYMSNWDALLEPASKTGVLPTLYPADLKIPMVAPADLGVVAAEMLVSETSPGEIRYVEGPQRYSAQDVADAFTKVSKTAVRLQVAPRENWEAEYRKLGFSEPAAMSYARMTAVSVDGDFEMPADPTRGSTSLQAYVDGLAASLAKA